ncbi:MAG: hypothetical protein AAFR51_05635 [Pseudomonadota bacterium]
MLRFQVRLLRLYLVRAIAFLALVMGWHLIGEYGDRQGVQAVAAADDEPEEGAPLSPLDKLGESCEQPFDMSTEAARRRIMDVAFELFAPQSVSLSSAEFDRQAQIVVSHSTISPVNGTATRVLLNVPDSSRPADPYQRYNAYIIFDACGQYLEHADTDSTREREVREARLLAFAKSPAGRYIYIPKCDPVPKVEGALYVVDVRQAQTRTNLIGEYERQGIRRSAKFAYVPVHIIARDQPISVMIASDEPVIFEFFGDIEQVVQVFVFGSSRFGEKFVGVLGLPADVIEGVPIAKRGGKGTPNQASNRACVPAQFVVPMQAPPIWEFGFKSREIEAFRETIIPEPSIDFVRAARPGVIRIDDGAQRIFVEPQTIGELSTIELDPARLSPPLKWSVDPNPSSRKGN